MLGHARQCEQPATIAVTPAKLWWLVSEVPNLRRKPALSSRTGFWSARMITVTFTLIGSVTTAEQPTREPEVHGGPGKKPGTSKTASKAITCREVDACKSSHASLFKPVCQYLAEASTVITDLHNTHVTVRLTMLWEKHRGYTCLSPAMPQLR
jgi:hypothetical protein